MSKIREYGHVLTDVATKWLSKKEPNREKSFLVKNASSILENAKEFRREKREAELDMLPIQDKGPALPFNDQSWSRPWKSDIDKAVYPEQSYDEWQAEIREKYATQNGEKGRKNATERDDGGIEL